MPDPNLIWVLQIALLAFGDRLCLGLKAELIVSKPSSTIQWV